MSARDDEDACRASHDVRTPLTAVRLTIEDLSLWPDTPESVAAQLRACLVQMDRLAEAVGVLLPSSPSGVRIVRPRTELP